MHIPYKGHVIVITDDPFTPSCNPRNEKEGSYLFIKVRHYHLGDFDKPNWKETDFISHCLHLDYGLDIDSFIEHDDDVIRKLVYHIFNELYNSEEVYAYIHSGITLNTSGFSCRWDSGKVGLICAPKFRDISNDKLKKEVEEYDNYLNSSYFLGYIIGNDNVPLDETFSGFDSEIDCINECKAYIDSLENTDGDS